MQYNYKNNGALKHFKSELKASWNWQRRRRRRYTKV